MILKKYKIVDKKFISTDPLQAQGFVQIKKQQNIYSVIIQINNFINKSSGVICCDKILKHISVTSATTKVEISEPLDIEKTCVLLTDLNLFAVKNSTDVCQQAIDKLNVNANSTNCKNVLDKIFGSVYDTYFFDCIKPKLANLFALGKSLPQLSLIYSTSKWAMVDAGLNKKIVGIIYKDNFAYAIAVGDEQITKTENILLNQSTENKEPNANLKNTNPLSKNLVTVQNRVFNLLFLSAKDGKFMQI